MLSEEEITLEFLADFLDPIRPLLDDPAVTDILVNSDGREVFCERGGELVNTGLRMDHLDLPRTLQHIARGIGEEVSEERPILNARLKDLRINGVIPPISQDGVSIAIRKFAGDRYTLSDLVDKGMLSRQLADSLQRALADKQSILVSGATGSGKTTLMTSLLRTIPESERIVLIQDTSEIRFSRPNLVRLESRPKQLRYGNKELPEITMRDLVKLSLRYRPDRLIIGETRGAEAWDLLQALNTGHGGSLSTLHANSPADALDRLSDLALEAGIALPAASIQKRIANAIQVCVHVCRQNGLRQVTDAVRLNGVSDGHFLTTSIR